MTGQARRSWNLPLGIQQLPAQESTLPTHLECIDVGGHVTRQLGAHERHIECVGPLTQQEPATVRTG